MKLKLVKSSDDWFCIEKADHEGVGALVPQGRNVMSFMWSGRISDADVEGTREEMLEIADAIINHDRASSTRCAVDARGDEALFWSPRNSQTRGAVPLTDAVELAMQIRRELGQVSPSEGDEP